MTEESYPLGKKVVTIFGKKVTLRELPTKYVIDVENGVIKDDAIGTCNAGSDCGMDVLDEMGFMQIEAMFKDIMVLSYGKDWEKKAKDSGESKKK